MKMAFYGKADIHIQLDDLRWNNEVYKSLLWLAGSNSIWVKVLHAREVNRSWNNSITVDMNAGIWMVYKVYEISGIIDIALSCL